jgi:hypothetical protein
MDNNCKTEHCKRCSFKVDKDEKGAAVVIFQTRHDNEKHLQKFTAEELEGMARMLRSTNSLARAAK